MSSIVNVSANDRDYHLRRAAAETVKANAATERSVQFAHSELAKLHTERGLTGEKSSRR